MKLINTDLLIARDSNIKLFKVNLVKEFRKKKIKDETMRDEYNSNAFERLLIEIEIKRRREEERKKVEEISQKKKMTETKKLAAAVKKKVDEMIKIEIKKIKEIARVEKKQTEKKEKTNKKRKRQEVKLLKDLEKIDKSKKFKRRKLQSSSISVNSTLQTKELEVNISSLNMKEYSYS
jgi:outer membrane biosynthesis protein TonB